MKPLFDVALFDQALDSFLRVQFPPIHITPLFAHVPSARVSTRTQLREALSDVQYTIASLVTLEEKIARLRRNLERRKEVILAFSTFNLATPIEILQRIFELAVADDPAPRTRIVLSHVCSRWRAASFGFCKLWSTIQIASGDQIKMFEEFAHRSGELPLHLHTIPLRATFQKHTSDSLASKHSPSKILILPEVARRVSSLHYGQRIPNVIWDFSRCHPSTLDSVHILSEAPAPPHPIPFNTAWTSAKTLSVGPVRLIMTSEERTVCTRLQHLRVHQTAFSDIVRMMRGLRFPRLDHLELCHIVMSRTISRPDVLDSLVLCRKRLRNLKTMEIKGCDQCIMDFALGGFVMPDLASIVLDRNTVEINDKQYAKKDFLSLVSSLNFCRRCPII